MLAQSLRDMLVQRAEGKYKKINQIEKFQEYSFNYIPLFLFRYLERLVYLPKND